MTNELSDAELQRRLLALAESRAAGLAPQVEAQRRRLLARMFGVEGAQTRVEGEGAPESDVSE